MDIEVQNITKRFHEFVALHDISVKFSSGELVALLGPSGCGKTTLLRIIAGLEQPDHGQVLFNNALANEQKIKERGVGFVFQHYALFKHMTVFENVAFGLRVKPKRERPSEKQIQTKVMELLELVHLGAFFDRYPSQLSGGQRQRVALARALAVEPRVLLLDEPFGALDAKVRKELRRWMRRLHDEMHITSVFVTHDQEEAMEVADRVVMMNSGKIEQVGTPDEVYNHPKSAFVYNFLGNFNEFEAWEDSSGEIVVGERSNSQVRRRLKVYARPHEIQITKSVSERGYVPAKVVHLNPAGSLVKLELERHQGETLQVEVSRSTVEKLLIKKGDALAVRPTQMRQFQ